MFKGYFSLVLHAHLPFVRHPEYESFFEEKWLFEAITETYLPLLRVFKRLEQDQIPFRITISISPSLAAMLNDELLQDRYIAHLEKQMELAEKELGRTRGDSEFHTLAEMYVGMFREGYNDYLNLYNRDILGQFKYFQEKGFLELITSSATHCYLPCIEMLGQGVATQVKLATRSHEAIFEKPSSGFWLPECGYYQGVEKYLEENGLRYFFVDTHGLLFADKQPLYGVYAPVNCPNGVAAFGRDPQSSRAVWSAEDGYPGDPSYREYYRDIGFDLPIDYIRPYIQDGDIRVNTGIKYYAITGSADYKRPYNRQNALRKTEEHADNFIYMRLKQIDKLAPLMDRPPLIVSPYDAELFGHWWFEGPEWIEKVIRKLARAEDKIQMITPGEYLSIYKKNQMATPSFSSWGNNGYSEVWLEKSNDWIYRHIHKVTGRMIDLATQFHSERGVRERTLNQAAREVLLSQASDWAFIMKTGTTVPYAIRRTKEHVHNFNKLYRSFLKNSINEKWLLSLEKKNNIFPRLNYRVFAEER